MKALLITNRANGSESILLEPDRLYMCDLILTAEELKIPLAELVVRLMAGESITTAEFVRRMVQVRTSI